MPDSTSTRQTGRIVFSLSSLTVVALCGIALKLLHAHAESHRAQLAVEYGMVLLGVFWTRSLESRLCDAGLPRWSFWPYFLIVFTGCLAAHLLKLTNSLETLALFLVLQLPADLFPSKLAPAESLPQGASAEEASKLVRKKPARPVTPLGAIEFAIYLLLIAGLLWVLHLLRGDVAGMAMSRALRFGLDAASVLLCVAWIFSVRGRLANLGLRRWVPGFCAVVLAACAVPFALSLLSFQHALVLFAVLQLPAVLLRRRLIPARLVEPETPEEADTDS